MHQVRTGAILAQATVCWLALALTAACSAFAADEADKWSEQLPQVAQSQVRGAKAAAESAEPVGGPKANWIWGSQSPGGDDVFYFRKQFAFEARAATLLAVADNDLTVFLNGKPLGTSGDWQQPLRRELRKELRQGQNELLVEAKNAGGPAGFALKLVMTGRDGQQTHLLSDGSWQVASSKDAKQWQKAHVLAKMGSQPWGDVFGGGSRLAGAPRGVFDVLPGFQVELLYTVPKETQGSWVSITFDPKGRLIASDQGGKGLYRVTPSPIGSQKPTRVEKLDAKITSAQGMLHAFGNLYLSVNGGPGSGLYRAVDADGDDQYDEVKLLKRFAGGGEHGPHAVRLSPDGKSLFVIAGNHTNPPADFQASRVPPVWGEDLLLPRQWDARGHARGKLAPGGWIARTDPNGESWEIFSIGYRNTYDMAFNADGELFAYDADMEWDMGSPWYRPTRVAHATSGSEFGWRSGTGKWPAYYLDSLPETVSVGPGSPTGVTYGAGAKFPAKYQQCLFITDWTFGTMYAVHLQPAGASYRGELEEFVSRSPLPLTDVEVGPDGALYFTVGGRGTQSELFRVTYVGPESTAPAKLENEQFAELRGLRRKLEAWHTDRPAKAADLEFIYEHLGHDDRYIRFAARTALEHRPLESWQQRVLAEERPGWLLNGIVALARQADEAARDDALQALARLDWRKRTVSEQLDALRAYSLVFIRLGPPSAEQMAEIAAHLDPLYPAQDDRLNRELSRVLVYLRSPRVIDKTLALMRQTRDLPEKEMAELLARNPGYGGKISQMLANQPDPQNVHYALVLRNLRYGWTLAQRREYFDMLAALREKKGGASYQGFIDNIRKEALANLSEAEKRALEQETLSPPPKPSELPKPLGPGRKWTTEDLLELTQQGLSGRSFEAGKRAFAAARCSVCHRFDGDGGATGPDLTNLAGRFQFKDLAEALVEPSKVISDQYRAHKLVTAAGKVYTGRIVGEDDQKLTLMVDPEDATKIVELPRDEIEQMAPSKVSLMPADLLNPLNKEEVLDLLAYLISRGNPHDLVFAK